MGFLADKRILITGVLSKHSIAYGIAKACHREGAKLAFTYQNEKLQSRVEKMAAELESDITIPCDVASDEEIKKVFEHLDDYWDHLDIIVHSVAYAPREALEGDYLDAITRESFNIAHEISSYSLTALAKAGRGMMQNRKGALLTLTYIGAERSVQVRLVPVRTARRAGGPRPPRRGGPGRRDDPRAGRFLSGPPCHRPTADPHRRR